MVWHRHTGLPSLCCHSLVAISGVNRLFAGTTSSNMLPSGTYADGEPVSSELRDMLCTHVVARQLSQAQFRPACNQKHNVYQ